MITDLGTLLPKTQEGLDIIASDLLLCPVAMICSCIEHLITEEVLWLKDEQFKECFCKLFLLDVPDVIDLPDKVLMSVKLKDDLKPMVASHTLSLKNIRRDGRA